jgi:cytochrome c biogenesis protein CcdA
MKKSPGKVLKEIFLEGLAERGTMLVTAVVFILGSVAVFYIISTMAAFIANLLPGEWAVYLLEYSVAVSCILSLVITTVAAYFVQKWLRRRMNKFL